MKNNFSLTNNSSKSKTHPIIVKVKDVTNLLPADIQTSSYWSWTFWITACPYIFWGCPFYLVTRQPPRTSPLHLVTSTGGWLKGMFDCCTFPLTSILTLILLIPTISLNIYVIYIFYNMFNHLFIAGTYEMSMILDVLELARYLPVIIPLDYIWLRGFRVNSMIILLNSLHGRYGGVGFSTVRLRLVIIIFAIFGVHIIRYFSYEKYELANGKPFLEIVENLLDFSVDLFCTLLLPLYCAFCYAVRFQLFTVKALVYKLIAQRTLPTVKHLDIVKTLYTQAADHIELINGMFSLYLSLALIITIAGTIFDAENLWKALFKVSGGTSNPSQFTYILAILAREIGKNDTALAESGESTNDEVLEFSASDIREINADLACILIIYGLVLFTIWQAVGTNDFAREIHVWLNDFVTGGGGTDVIGVLQDLGLKQQETVASSGTDKPVILVESDEKDCELIWARDTLIGCGMHDEFLKKFRMLKAYIHARMQLEKPALLNITLVGILVPALGGRLRRYQLMF